MKIMMKPNESGITVEGVRLTRELIETLKMWQNEDGLRIDLNTIDDTISFITREVDNGGEEGWNVVSNLCRLKDYLKKMKGD